jgi:hypothetical protein
MRIRIPGTLRYHVCTARTLSVGIPAGLETGPRLPQCFHNRRLVILAHMQVTCQASNKKGLSTSSTASILDVVPRVGRAPSEACAFCRVPRGACVSPRRCNSSRCVPPTELPGSSTAAPVCEPYDTGSVPCCVSGHSETQQMPNSFQPNAFGRSAEQQATSVPAIPMFAQCAQHCLVQQTPTPWPTCHAPALNPLNRAALTLF